MGQKKKYVDVIAREKESYIYIILMKYSTLSILYKAQISIRYLS